MTSEDTIPGGFVFAPDTNDAVECELDTQELKGLAPRSSIALIHDADRNKGYDPYNTGAYRARVPTPRTGPTKIK
jgi:hypothetical protein